MLQDRLEWLSDDMRVLRALEAQGVVNATVGAGQRRLPSMGGPCINPVRNRMNGYTPMFDNLLMALPIIVIAAIALWLVNRRRIKRGQPPFRSLGGWACLPASLSWEISTF